MCIVGVNFYLLFRVVKGHFVTAKFFVVLLVTLPNIAQARELTMCIDPRFAKQGELKVYTNMLGFVFGWGN